MSSPRRMLVSCSVPLYYEVKLVGLLWLMTPQTKGAQLLYETVITPFLTQHAARFDPVFATAKMVSPVSLSPVRMLLHRCSSTQTDACNRRTGCLSEQLADVAGN